MGVGRVSPGASVGGPVQMVVVVVEAIVDVTGVLVVGATVVDVFGAASSDPQAEVSATTIVAEPKDEAIERRAIPPDSRRSFSETPDTRFSGVADAMFPRCVRFVCARAGVSRGVVTTASVVEAGGWSFVATRRPTDGRTPC